VTPEEWQRLSPVLDQVLDLPETEQAAFLGKLRADNPELCREVESLLAQQQPTPRLEAPPLRLLEALHTMPAAAREPAEPKLPDVPGYEVHERLGRGSMGVVYRARHVALDRVVALKLLRAGAQADAEDLLRFRTEAEAAARLHHPNIVQIYEVGRHDGQAYLSLEYVAGGGLDWFLAGTPQPARPAAEVVEKLARTMDYAHGRGILHRDLKPANVLLAFSRELPASVTAALAGSSRLNEAVPKISDFGLAKRLHAGAGQTQTGAVLGTPSYMAPEQAAGRKEVGPAADIYALGAILYEMLTGRPPFRGPSAYETLLQVREAEPVAPSRLQPNLPRDLETICLTCLQKAPAKRYGSAAALADDLRRYLDGRPIRARPVGRLERAWRWCRRNPKDAAFAGAGVLALLLAAVAYLGVASARHAAEQERRDRQARATTEAERDLAEAELLWDQAKTAAVYNLLPWEKALAAAHRAGDVAADNAVEEPTRRRVQQTLAAVTAAKQEAEARAVTAAEDERMKPALESLAFSQLQLTTRGGKGFVLSARADAEYRRVFRSYHDIDLNHPDEAEAQMRTSAIKPQLLAAIDAWIPLRPDAEQRRRLADLANRLAEPDDLRHDLREALAGQDHARLLRLAQRDLSALSPRMIFDVALTLSNGRDFEAAAALLRPAQQGTRPTMASTSSWPTASAS
jgi:hypothetical protein